ncbi:hypothetical protein P4C99_03660 [Pontiellaceae bacterium B1224]|nr:hypothetical protein [Pontiellaceae bacterium B1224]
MGGGLVTATALPLVAMLGVWPCLLITAAILAIWIIYGLIRARKKS